MNKRKGGFGLPFFIVFIKKYDILPSNMKPKTVVSKYWASSEYEEPIERGLVELLMVCPKISLLDIFYFMTDFSYQKDFKKTVLWYSSEPYHSLACIMLVEFKSIKEQLIEDKSYDFFFWSKTQFLAKPNIHELYCKSIGINPEELKVSGFFSDLKDPKIYKQKLDQIKLNNKLGLYKTLDLNQREVYEQN